jgi:large subunit ribosomal protein LP0
MPKIVKSEKRIKKEKYWDRLQHVAATYKNACFIDANNVSSKQICLIRAKLRNVNAVMIMGKNTLMKAALSDANRKPEQGDEDYEERSKTFTHNTNIDLILPQLKGNINLIFTNGDLGEIKDILDSEVRPSPAKAGMIAPEPVTIPAGATGLDPKQTSFFQKLNIQTKIVKAQIDIVTSKQVIEVGDKIDGTQALLLDKLKIYPFSYKMAITKILQDGAIFDAKVLSLNNETIIAKFKAAAKLQASVSLAAGFPTQASAPHSVLGAFKNMIAVCAATGYEFEEASAFLAAAKNAPAAGAATGGASKEAAPVEEKKEEPEDVDMGGLFGGDDDEY